MSKGGRIVGYTPPIHKLDNKKDGLEALYMNGHNNLYPYYVDNSVTGSPIASRARNLHASYIAGEIDIDDVVIDKENEVKLTQFNFSAAKDLSIFDGFFVHVTYGLDGKGGFKKKGFRLLEFKDCRITKKDDSGYWSFVYVDDFYEKMNGKFKKEDSDWYYRYNDDSDAILAQIKRDCEIKGLETESEDWLIGGIRNYRGQVRFFNFTSDFPYPASPVDAILNDCNVDYYNSKYNIEQSSNGFMGKTVAFVRENPSATDQDNLENLFQFIGTDESGGLFVQPINASDDPERILHFKTFEMQFDDKLQKATHLRNKENIYGAFDNIPWLLVEGNSGAMFSATAESYELASKLYSARTRRRRQFLNESISELTGIEFNLLNYDGTGDR